MPEWNQLVRERLGALGIAPQLEDEVVAELAAHLEDRFNNSSGAGMSESAALVAAMEEVPDWIALNREISDAKKEKPMNERTRTLWLPGMSMLVGAYLLMEVITRLVPHNAWTRPEFPLIILVPWLAIYGVIGALGARWSRNAGGSVSVRFLAGIFPAALHLFIFLCVLIATFVQKFPHTPEWLNPLYQLKIFVTFILLPATALSLGAAPFLRVRAAQTPLPAGSR